MKKLYAFINELEKNGYLPESSIDMLDVEEFCELNDIPFDSENDSDLIIYNTIKDEIGYGEWEKIYNSYFN